MLLSTSSQYAITGVLRLSAVPRGGYCRVEDLVEGTPASKHAVAKVFYELAKRRMLQSIRGIGGGYRLCEGIGQLTLMDLVEAVDGPYDATVLTARGLCRRGSPCPLGQLLQPVGDRLEQILRTTRVADLLAIQPTRDCCGAAAAKSGAARPLGFHDAVRASGGST